jgi:outer membrane protein assembly factor BamB
MDRRRVLRSVPAGLLPLLAGTWSTTSGMQSPAAVTQRGNSAQTGEFPGPGPADNPAVVWRFHTGGPCPSGTYGGYVDPPAVTGGIAFVAAASSFAAIDAGSGEPVWQVGSGSAFYGAAVTDDLVITGTAEFESGRSLIVAFAAATGTPVWEHPVAGRPVGFTVGDGLVVSGSANPTGSRIGTLYALDALTGAEVWRIEDDGQFNRPAFVSGRIIVANGGTLRAVDAADGAAVWTVSLDGFVLSPAVTTDLAFIGGDEILYAVAIATGEVVWTFDTGAYNARAAVAAGRVFVTGSGAHRLDALDAATGQVLWSFPTDDELGVASVANGVVYAGSGLGTVYAVDAATGEARWSLAVPASFATTSPVIAEGLVYLGAGGGGELTAIGDSERLPSGIYDR